MEDARKAIIFTASILGFIISGLIIYKLSPVITPFLIAFFLAYLFNPLITALTNIGTKQHLPRTLAVVFIFLILVFLIGLVFFWLMPALIRELSGLVEYIPELINWLQIKVVPIMEQLFDTKIEFNIASMKELLRHQASHISQGAAWVSQTILQSGLGIAYTLINVGIIIVVTFYLMRDWNKVKIAFIELFNKRGAKTANSLLQKCNDVLGAFLRGQLMVMLALGIIYSIGLSLIGVKFSLILGMMSGLLSIVPYFGSIVGVVVSTITATVQFQDWLHPTLVLLAFGVGQTLESMILTPYLVGDKLGLHPIAVIFAIMAGGQLMGFVGILIALPVAAILVVMMREIKINILDAGAVR